jgi:hypothetical protein
VAGVDLRAPPSFEQRDRPSRRRQEVGDRQSGDATPHHDDVDVLIPIDSW